jgi:hypothetical protein
MSDSKRHRDDLAFVANVLSRYQQSDGHGEMVVRIQDGCVTVVEENRKHKPTTEEGRK